MKKFLVLYMTPVAVMQNWMKTPEAERKATEARLKGEWIKWADAHKGSLVGEPSGVGKPKRITATGVVDASNDIMICDTIQANTIEEAVTLFEGHPHLEVPESTIEIMEISPIVDNG